ncbi:hypothetical protein ACRBEV_05620 [Methylobacterium phyllosphaerae]
MFTLDIAAYAVVLCCMSSSFVLALINNNLKALSPNIVTLVQLVLTVCPICLTIIRRPSVDLIFVYAVYLVLLNLFISYAVRGEFEVKLLYDVMIVPIFISLGLTLDRLDIRFIHLSLAIVLAVAAFENLLRDVYINSVNPASFFFNTRSWVAEYVGAGGVEAPGAYVGTYRPGGSAIGESELGYRSGSIFLEPLSLGYFSCVIFIAYMHYYRHSTKAKVASFFFCELVAFLADTRVAFALVAVLYIVAPALRRISTPFSFGIPVLLITFSIIAYRFAIHGRSDGDLLLRLSWTFDVIQGLGSRTTTIRWHRY